MARIPLGEVLLQRGLISETQLSHALSLQQRHGSRLGDIMIGEGITGYYALYGAVAEHYGLPFIDLLREPPDTRLLHPGEADLYLRLRAIPWRAQDGEVTVAACELSDEVMAWVRRRFGASARLAITSPFDIRRSVESLFGQSMENSSRLALWRKFPRASARTTMSAPQKRIVYALIFLTFAVALALPGYTALALMIVCHTAYGATMLFKCWVFAHGTRTAMATDWKHLLPLLDERQLPVYTVLVPMYREAASLPGLLEAMQRLDYPASRLDIKLVLEADDQETLNAARMLKPRYQFDIIRVPASIPRTKPKACNYALRFARGEFITIFDADDRPDRMQLKKAVHTFRTLPPDVICLQARLNYYNAGDNLLTRLFSLEYTMLFHFMLYGLERLGIPLPLGGTSNHIALQKLKALGEWDPYNVTEDADLGTRLAVRGFRTAMLDSYTMEEAPNTVMPWIRQRSRWIKGYMQTWLVHMRHPVQLYRALGPKGFIGFQFFVGLSGFIFLTAPLVWGVSLLWFVQPRALAFPPWLAWLAAANLGLNLLSQWYFALYSALLYRKHLLPVTIAALLYPLYLVLHSLASYKALWQLIVKPHFWEKTVHGLARTADSAAGESEWLQLRGIRLTAA